MRSTDLAMMGLLKTVGIGKGIQFAPDADTRAVLKTAAQQAESLLSDWQRSYAQPWWPGDILDGGQNYTLHIPPNVPAAQHWALTVYDAATSGFIRNAEVINLDSYNQAMERNPDGSVDIYLGPTPPTVDAQTGSTPLRDTTGSHCSASTDLGSR